MILDKEVILSNAKMTWDRKDNAHKIRAGSKYNHFLTKLRVNDCNWSRSFEQLSVYQRNILIKGELIRTYDSLPNKSKTNIMRELGLSTFSSKWYKLPGKDKKILLNNVIK